MQPMTQFLSQMMAFVFVILAISLWTNNKFYIEMFKQIEKDKVGLFFASIIEMVLGLAIVLQHNLWSTLPEIVVTLIGWGAILEGIAALFWTKKYKKMALRVFSQKGIPYFTGLLGIIGLYLAWVGFMG